MSRGNVETVRRLYESWIRGDFTSGIEVFDPDVEFVIEAPVSPSPVSVRGLAAMGEAWRENLSGWGDFRVEEIDQLVETKDDVVVFNVLLGRGRRSGVVVEQADRAAIFSFRDGRICRLRLTNRAMGLKAAGLPEWAMSDENVEIIRRAFADYAREGLRPRRGYLAPDVVWNPADEAAQYGEEAVIAYMERWESEWEDLKTVAEEIVDAGDRVFVTVNFSGRGRLSGAEVNARIYEVYTLKDGKIVRMDEFTDRAAALEAAGLRE